MKAFGYGKGLEIKHPESLVERLVNLPQLKPRDVLVKVEAVSINPVDAKARGKGLPLGEGDFHIPGWDVAGRVVEKGALVNSLNVGDEVYYAGSIHRNGANSEFHAVDERIVARRPRTLTAVEAAALPLTSLTAWEALFDRMKLSRGESEKYKNKSLLVIGGSGGVGSVAIQLAKRLIGIKVIATASREQSREWCRKLGADVVVDHSKDLLSQFQEPGLKNPDYILCTSDTDHYFDVMAELINPQGVICSIVEAQKNLPLGNLMRKSVTFAWELMFTRSLFETEDMENQSKILQTVAELIDSGKLTTTASQYLGEINLENIRRGHELIESGRSIGKIVLGEKK